MRAMTIALDARNARGEDGLGAERLDLDDLGLDAGEARAVARALGNVLRADAQRDRRAGRQRRTARGGKLDGRLAELDRAGRPCSPVARAGSRFMGGLPRKAATKVLAGRL